MKKADRIAAALIGAATLVQFAWFLHAMRRMTGEAGGVLDDSYIHFAYATSLAHGHFFEWTPGAGYSTGATSFLWPVLLTPAHWLGLSEGRMALWAAGLGAIGLFLCGWFAWRIVRDEVGEGWGALAATLVTTSGALGWGSFGGMEIPLIAALAIGLVRAMQLGRERTALLLAALLPLARPEWAIVTAIVILLYRRRRLAVALAAFPLVAYLALNLVLTGRTSTNGMLVKSLLHDPNLSFGGAAGAFWDQLLQLTQWELGKLRLVPLGAPLLAAIGAIRPSRTARLCALFAAVGLLVTLTARDAFRHFNRYQMPALPLLCCAAAFGLAALCSLAAEGRLRALVAALGSVVLVGFQLVFFHGWADQFAHNCRDIQEQQVAMARWMRANLPAGTRIAVNDAGAIPLVSGLPAIDLVGLGTNEFAEAWREGQGAVFEKLERLPPERRPKYFAIYPTWVGLYDLYGTVVHKVTLTDNRTAGEIEKQLLPARWDVAGSGARPLLPHAGAVVDELDVADLQSEREHDFRIDRPAPTFYRHENYFGRGTSIACSDGGRVMHRHQRFRVTVTPGREARLIWREDSWFRHVVRVLVDGHEATRVAVNQARAFVEPEAVLPAALLTRQHPEIRIELAEGGELATFHYWIMQ